MNDSSKAISSKPYDDEYVFKLPFMRFEAYKDGEFERDERLLLTALTGRYKLKTDGFHRLIAKFIMHLNGFPSGFKESEVDVPPFASEFRSTKELSNQIELSDVFDCDLNEEQLLEKLTFEDPALESYYLCAKSWLFAAISSLLIRAKIRNPKCQKSKYRKLCYNKLRAISAGRCPFDLDKTPLKIAINFGKFEQIMKKEGDALRFAICWMVLVLENYPRSNAAHLFKFCFLDNAENHGLALFVHWDQLKNHSKSELEWRRWSRIAENIDGVRKSLENLARFYEELPTKADADGKRKVFSLRWRYCRLVDHDYFNYCGISTNLKACMAMLFVIDLIRCSTEKRYPEFVKSREKRSGFQKLTDEEEDCLRKEQKKFEGQSMRRLFLTLTDFQKEALAGDEDYERFLAENEKSNSDSNN